MKLEMEDNLVYIKNGTHRRFLVPPHSQDKHDHSEPDHYEKFRFGCQI